MNEQVDPKEKRKQIKQQQEQWLKERRNQQIRRNMERTLHATRQEYNPIHTATSTSMDIQSIDHQTTVQGEYVHRIMTEGVQRVQHLMKSNQVSINYSDKVIEMIRAQLEKQVREDVREELKKEAESAKNEKMEKFLSEEIEQHTCPICFEMMTPPKNSPIILLPCGHTMCSTCLLMHKKQVGGKKCPQCRQDIKTQAPNISLQQIIVSYVEKKKYLDDLKRKEMEQQTSSMPQPKADTSQNQYASAPPNPNDSETTLGKILNRAPKDKVEEVERYFREYRKYKIRIEILQNELRDSEIELNQLRNKENEIQEERDKWSKKEAEINEQIENLMKMLEDIHNQVRGNSEMLDSISITRQNVTKKIDTIQITLQSLNSQIEKARVIVQNYAPGVDLDGEY